MSNIVIYPTSGILEFNTGVAGASTLDNSLSGASRFTFNSGETNITSYATGNLNRLTIDGSQGRLFLIDDLLSGNLFSVNTIAGLPVVQANSDYTIIMGQYNQNNLVITGGSVGIGGLPITGTQKLYVSGNVYVSGNIYLSGNSVMTGNSASFVTTAQTGVFATSTNLISTGSNLQSQISSLSGTLTGNYVLTSTATGISGTLSSSIASTGSNLQTQITSLSGQVVYTTGNQTISGVKTFLSGINISGSVYTASGFQLYDAGLAKIVTITCFNGILSVN